LPHVATETLRKTEKNEKNNLKKHSNMRTAQPNSQRGISACCYQLISKKLVREGCCLPWKTFTKSSCLRHSTIAVIFQMIEFAARQRARKIQCLTQKLGIQEAVTKVENKTNKSSFSKGALLLARGSLYHSEIKRL